MWEMWAKNWMPLPLSKEDQYLIKYVDGTLDTECLTEEDAVELREHHGIEEIRKLVGYSKIALEQSELQFKEVVSS